jgi:hypothetical protein
VPFYCEKNSRRHRENVSAGGFLHMRGENMPDILSQADTLHLENTAYIIKKLINGFLILCNYSLNIFTA